MNMMKIRFMRIALLVFVQTRSETLFILFHFLGGLSQPEDYPKNT